MNTTTVQADEANSIFDERDTASSAEMDSSLTDFASKLGVKKGHDEFCYSAEMSNEQYHSVRTHISHTGMIELLRSEAHYAEYCNPSAESTPRSGFNLGTAFHAAVLEPGYIEENYVVYEKRRQGKEWEAFAEEHAGKEIVNQREIGKVMAMLEAFKAYKEVPLWDIFHSAFAEREKSVFWIDEETGCGARVRFDVITDEAVFDLKTINDARPKNVMRQVAQMEYDLQASMYAAGGKSYIGKKLPFIFVFIEDKAPYGIQVYASGDTTLRNGEIKFRRGMNAFKRYQEKLNADTPLSCYSGKIQTLELPSYALITEDL